MRVYGWAKLECPDCKGRIVIPPTCTRCEGVGKVFVYEIDGERKRQWEQGFH